MTHFLILLSFLFGIPQQDSDGSTIHVVLTDGRSRVGGMVVSFETESGESNGRCTTAPQAGSCDIVGIQAVPNQLIRGHLTVGDFGKRAVTWPGGYLALEIDISSMADSNHAPHEYSINMDTAESSMTPAVQRVQTALPPSPKPIATTDEPDSVVSATRLTPEASNSPPWWVVGLAFFVSAAAVGVMLTVSLRNRR